jgi:hypothetical protein
MIVRVSARSSQQWCWQWGVLWEIPGCAKSIFGSEEIHDFSMEVFFLWENHDILWCLGIQSRIC